LGVLLHQFDERVDAAVEYAYRVEANQPARWDE
jgi:hypothetical protein